MDIHRLIHSSFLLSEHKHCDNAATNSNSENARSRMVASLRGSLGTGTKEDESSTGRVWAAGFHHVAARFLLARVLKLWTVYFFNFPNIFRAAVNRRYWIHGYGGPPVQTTIQLLQFRINPYPTAFPYGNGMVLHFYQQQESSTTKTVHKVINKGLKTYV